MHDARPRARPVHRRILHKLFVAAFGELSWTQAMEHEVRLDADLGRQSADLAWHSVPGRRYAREACSLSSAEDAVQCIVLSVIIQSLRRVCVCVHLVLKVGFAGVSGQPPL